MGTCCFGWLPPSPTDTPKIDSVLAFPPFWWEIAAPLPCLYPPPPWTSGSRFSGFSPLCYGVSPGLHGTSSFFLSWPCLFSTNFVPVDLLSSNGRMSPSPSRLGLFVGCVYSRCSCQGFYPVCLGASFCTLTIFPAIPFPPSLMDLPFFLFSAVPFPALNRTNPGLLLLICPVRILKTFPLPDLSQGFRPPSLFECCCAFGILFFYLWTPIPFLWFFSTQVTFCFFGVL